MSQVEYSFPPLVPGSKDQTECPTGWKYLPTLALPDGSHNYDDDTVYFHLPSLSHPRKTVYGISCFRQIPVEVRFLTRVKLVSIIFMPLYLFMPNVFCIVLPEIKAAYPRHDKRNCTEISVCSQ